MVAGATKDRVTHSAWESLDILSRTMSVLKVLLNY